MIKHFKENDDLDLLVSNLNINDEGIDSDSKKIDQDKAIDIATKKHNPFEPQPSLRPFHVRL